ncbi:MAG TPA: response regulator, partial [Stellaceae bacterium]|nr:response regulator [Stellaceae bacterium]
AREAAERAHDEAEAASRAKSAFLANMSHELRTPLNAIIGYSEMLVEDANDRGDDATVSDLEKIQGAGKHLLGLINGILDLSKIEAGRMDIYLEQVYLAKLVEDVRTIVEPVAAKNGNRLVVDCPSDIGSIRSDLTKLKQSLINLLSNAAKFTKDGTVRLSLSRAIGKDGVARVSFAVSDNGIGMTEEQINRLFQAFTQADSSTTRHFGGTGLGLTITKHFSTMLGGTIEVTSKPGAGSTFIMTLPDQTMATAASIEAESQITSTERGSGDGLTVLVADDDPAVHDMLTGTLIREGYRVLHANDGAEALEVVRRFAPDIVTLDVMMPKIDGWSVLGTMKSDPELSHIPVILITIVDDRNLGYSLGASEYMTKPIDRARLVALVRQFTAKDAGGQVLIVDDDPAVRHLVKVAVEGAGLEAATAENGKAGLDWLSANPPPSLILLDLMMPEMDGFEFLDKMRGNKTWHDVPVVVLTAKELTEAERGFLAQRTILVLSKSAQPISSLGAALSTIAQSRVHETARPKPAAAEKV